MPKTSVIQTNFTAGEISPRLLGRVDIDKYRNAAESMVNCHPLVHGGCIRRDGKRRVAGAKFNAKLSIMIPFVLNKNQAYQLELGDRYMRFYTQAKAQIQLAGVPVEVVTPFLEGDLDDIHYVQRSGVLYLAHVSYPMQQLTRRTDTDWKLVPVPFAFEPTAELEANPVTSITLSALTGAITITAAAAAFQNSDVGRRFISGNGVATITGFTSTTVLSATVVDNFSALAIVSGAWGLDQSPKTTITPSAVGPLGAAITLTTGVATWQNSGVYSHLGRVVNVNGGLVELTSFSTTTVINGIVRSVLSSVLTVGADGWTLESKAWNAANGFPNAVGTYQQRLVAGGTTKFPQGLWATKTGIYDNFAVGANANDGLVFTINSDQQNIIQHLTVSRYLAVLTYGGEVIMRGGVESALSSTNVQAETQSAYGCNNVRPLRIGNEILFWTRSGRKLRAMAYQITSDSFLSPDMTVLAEHITSGGIVQMSYSQEPDSLIYALRADGVLCACTFDRDQNVIGWSRVTTDGVIESVSSNPAGAFDQTWNVVARAVGGAIVRSVEVDDPLLNTDFSITGSNFRTVTVDLGWAAGVYTLQLTGHTFVEGETISLRNFINTLNSTGLTGKFVVHILDADRFTVPVAVNPGSVLIFGQAAFAASVWTGFSYCEGRNVRPIADGSPQPLQTVLAGAITLARKAYEIEAGLEYSNYVDVLPVEQPGQFGTAQGSAIGVNRVVARFYKTVGATINGTQIPTRAFGTAVLDKAVVPFTGDLDLTQIGWNANVGGRVRIGQDLPLPWQLLAVIREVSANI